MGFLLKSIQLQLNKHFIAYIILFIEIFISMMIITMSSNMSVSFYDIYNDTKKQYGDEAMMITSFGENTHAQLPFTRKDLDALPKEMRANAQLRYLKIISSKEKLKQYILIYDSNIKNQIYIGKNLEKDQQVEVDYKTHWKIEDGQVNIHGLNYKVYPIKDYSSSKYAVFGRIQNYPMEDVMIVPFALLKNEKQDGFGSLIITDVQKDQEKEIMKLQKYLEDQHPGEKYFVEYITKAIHDVGKMYNSGWEFYAKIAVFLAIQLLFGYTGLVIFSMKQEEQFIAIKMTLGAKRRRILMEYFLLNTIIILSGTILGTITGHLVTIYLIPENPLFSNHPSWISTFFCIMLAISSLILSLLPISYKLKRLSLRQILREANHD